MILSETPQTQSWFRQGTPFLTDLGSGLAFTQRRRSKGCSERGMRRKKLGLFLALWFI